MSKPIPAAAGEYQITLLCPDGQNPTRLTTNSTVDDQPVWSPDHSKIAFASQRDADWEIYVMDADGGNQTRLTHTPGTDFLPVWSPDGSKLYGSSNGAGFPAAWSTANTSG